MEIITTARHFEMTPEIREHAEKRLEKLRRFLGGVDEVHVVLATERYRQIAEIALHARGTEVISRSVSDDMLASIDRVVDRLERQLERLTARRKRNRKMRRTPRLDLAQSEPAALGSAATDEDEEEEGSGLDEEMDFSPVVVRGDQFHPDPISVEKAIEILRDRNEDFMLFKNTQSQKINLIHVRPDGNYGLVETA
ncbi:MAG: ribosome-associated translation inhibitor RaiA [Candidatus Eisenbacteria sp.]|nr:ribosome-associated translation inhibitor RaiA [Candidatus Eisenbacteria bacterium]